MIYLRVRNIGIDVLPGGEPFISVNVEKIFLNEDGFVEQTIGNFDRMYKRLSDINLLPTGTIADGGVIDPLELYSIIAQTVYVWVIEKYGGTMRDSKLVVDS